jgi:hypothetical protein
MSRLRKFLGRSWPDRLLLLEAFAWLTLAKLLIHGVPFRWLARRLGFQMAQSPETVSDSERVLACRVGWAVEAVARHSPIQFVCFPQAIAAKWMLRRRGLPSTLYLGAKIKEKDKLDVHAWLRVGDRILTGGEQSRRHKTIVTFAESA